MTLPPDLKTQLLKRLQERGVSGKCELCGNNNWAVAEQAVGLALTDLSGTVVIPGPQIPVGALVCNHCGNVRTFSLGALGLLVSPTAAAKDD